MTDAVLASIVGGFIAIGLKAFDYYIDTQKRQSEQVNKYEEQKVKFLETVLERLEHVNHERDEAEGAADQFREKYWKALEDRIEELETRNRRRLR